MAKNQTERKLYRPTFVRLAARERRELEKLAEREERSLSGQIRHIIAKHLHRERRTA